MTCFATNPLMRTGQGETRAPFVIEQRRLPFRAVMTVGTRSDPADVGELCSVNVLVTLLALAGRGLKVDIHHPRFHVGRLVAVNAGRSPVRAHQREGGLRVIEFLQVLPRRG